MVSSANSRAGSQTRRMQTTQATSETRKLEKNPQQQFQSPPSRRDRHMVVVGYSHGGQQQALSDTTSDRLSSGLGVAELPSIARGHVHNSQARRSFAACRTCSKRKMSILRQLIKQRRSRRGCGRARSMSLSARNIFLRRANCFAAQLRPIVCPR